ncbi:secretin N-terminal domain-containing protein [Methylophaga sp.]|jgi:hypothetical protein|uniref:secretin N-terminal domain-containing protein n=1 Tax=Methylophaga sp. TaxID=2024840 RepID=UPI0013FF3A89|nr:secretin N-terminal domain-containing protein [Methylophaga sp.]MTI63999.1 hypothetical protein [Methylophaga sp.]
MRIVLLLSALLLSVSVFAETQIHTINLKHRLAAEILPQIEAFLPETATIRAYDNVLILKSDRATLANVQQLLEQLDKPQQSLIVTVTRSTEDLSHQRGRQDQLELEADEDIQASVNINRWSTKNSDDRDQHYRARTISGNPVSISLGEDTPQQQQLVFVGPRGVAVANETRYISTANGFQAVPYLLPDGQVRVEIHPFFSKLSRVDGDIRGSEVITTVVGQTGEWLEIGRITENAEQQREGVTSYRSHGEQQQILYLKIELSN